MKIAPACKRLPRARSACYPKTLCSVITNPSLCSNHEITCSLSFQRKKGRKTDSMMFRGTIYFFRFSDLGKKSGTTDRCLLCQ